MFSSTNPLTSLLFWSLVHIFGLCKTLAYVVNRGLKPWWTHSGVIPPKSHSCSWNGTSQCNKLRCHNDVIPNLWSELPIQPPYLSNWCLFCWFNIIQSSNLDNLKSDLPWKCCWIIPSPYRSPLISALGSTNQRPGGQHLGAWYVQSLHGLSFLHYHGVLHRDIKPETGMHLEIAEKIGLNR
jgi:hypothetical protein